MKIQEQTERRQFTRVSVQIEGELCMNEGLTIQGVSRDVSLGGVFLVCDHPLPVGANCAVKLYLGDRKGASRVDAFARIVRLESAGVGLAFTDIHGLDSFDHLRNLVLYNSHDKSERVEEEFQRHHGIKQHTNPDLCLNGISRNTA